MNDNVVLLALYFWLDDNLGQSAFPYIYTHTQKWANPLRGVYTSNLFNDLDFYLDQILFLYEAKYLGQIFSQTFYFIGGQYLAQIKFQIV